jgi:hypothetical protein
MLEGSGHKVSEHVTRGTPNDRDFLLLDSIGDEEITDIDVFCAFAAQSFTVFSRRIELLLS